ncbi:MAG TPA: radical SAM protein [Candidatus Aquilonibacter sp.]|jgi:anaerobic magnesium-protoporphyrin IX monomethyl ester cyclase|nr:radical SAM protein [Candidatus Aquilonibacter sp.]
MDILLTHGYFLYEDPKELQIMKPYPPLGILYICSHLREKGVNAEVFDSTFSSRQKLFDLLQQGPPSVLGVYANLMTRSNVVEILKVAKDAGWRTLVGGPEPSAYVQEYLAAGADVVVIGEGELTLEELVPALRDHAFDKFHQIDGIAFRSPDGSVVRTKPRAQIGDIDAQPWPARESIDMAKYVEVWRKHHGMGSVSLITARGCPYHCRWCSHEVFGKTHRRRKPVSVADELEWLIDRYQPQMAWMADDVFTIHHGWLFQYADELKRRGLKLPFECISRADRLNLKIVETLAEMGCFRVWIGSESGSQRILDAMERGVTVEQVQSSVALCRSAGIQTGMFLMWGYEGEDLSDIEATVEHVKKTDPDIFFTTVSYPIKGTPYFSDVAERVESLKPWRESSDREFKVRDRHSREFYRFADKLLRSEVELERLTHRPNADDAALASLRCGIAEARAGLQATNAEIEV